MADPRAGTATLAFELVSPERLLVSRDVEMAVFTAQRCGLELES